MSERTRGIIIGLNGAGIVLNIATMSRPGYFFTGLLLISVCVSSILLLLSKP